MIGTLIQDTIDGLRRMRFSPKHRTDFYKQLAMLLKNGAKQRDALSKLRDVFSLNGEKPNNIKAVVADDCLAALSDGEKLADALGDWAPYEEVATIAAGERSNSGPHVGFLRAALLLKRKVMMRKAVVGALSYPAVLLAALLGVLYYISVTVMPTLMSMTKEAEWDTSTYVMAGMANLIGHHATEVMLCVGGGVLFVLWSMNNLVGIPRVYFDRFPPWSIARMVRGATFLYNFGVLQASNVKALQILDDDLERANPYMAERLEGAKMGVKLGKNLGEALYDAGYEFPSRQAIEYLRLIVTLDGGPEQLMEFADDWMTDTIEQVGALGSMIGNLALLSIFAVMGLVISGMSSVAMKALGVGV